MDKNKKNSCKKHEQMKEDLIELIELMYPKDLKKLYFILVRRL